MKISIKRTRHISEILNALRKRIVRWIKKQFIKIAPVLFVKAIYRKVHGKRLNLKNPKSFNEKLNWLKLYGVTPLMVRCSDKYRVRDYVREKNLSHILPGLLGVYESSSEILWDTLPDKFVLKCNHGCGYNIVCRDKSKLDRKEASKKLDKWLREDFSYHACEPQYRGIKPVIMCEEFLNDGNPLPNDYKIYCFNGVPGVALGCYDRAQGVQYEFYDPQWNVLDISKWKNRKQIRKPDSLDKMVEYSAELSKPFCFVRVDWYDINSKPVLGEMSFMPSAGMRNDYTETGQEYLGSLLGLSKPPGGAVTSSQC